MLLGQRLASYEALSPGFALRSGLLGSCFYYFAAQHSGSGWGGWLAPEEAGALLLLLFVSGLLLRLTCVPASLLMLLRLHATLPAPSPCPPS